MINTTEIRNVLDSAGADKELQNLSKTVFEIDEESFRIIQLLSEKGPLIEYQIGKYGHAYGLNRHSVGRRLTGTESLVSLRDEGFVQVVNQKEFRKTGKKAKTYGLGFKGLIASLHYVRFEDTYIVKSYRQILTDILEDDTLTEFAVLYAKFSIGLVLSWNKIVKNNLTKFSDLETMFSDNFIEAILTSRLEPLKRDDLNLINKFENKFANSRLLLEAILKNKFSNDLQKIFFKRLWEFLLKSHTEEIVVKSFYEQYATNPKGVGLRQDVSVLPDLDISLAEKLGQKLNIKIRRPPNREGLI